MTKLKFYQPPKNHYKFETSVTTPADGSTPCKRVTAISTYRQKQVKAHATCHPRDDYNEETGRQLAMARLDLKIACMRAKHAAKLLDQAQDAIERAIAHKEKVRDYYCSANHEYRKQKRHLQGLEDRLKSRRQVT